MKCPHCKESFQIYIEEKIINNGNKYMLRASCPSCHKWIKWLAFSESKILSSEEIQEMYNYNDKKLN